MTSLYIWACCPDCDSYTQLWGIFCCWVCEQGKYDGDSEAVYDHSFNFTASLCSVGLSRWDRLSANADATAHARGKVAMRIRLILWLCWSICGSPMGVTCSSRRCSPRRSRTCRFIGSSSASCFCSSCSSMPTVHEWAVAGDLFYW